MRATGCTSRARASTTASARASALKRSASPTTSTCPSIRAAPSSLPARCIPSPPPTSSKHKLTYERPPAAQMRGGRPLSFGAVKSSRDERDRIGSAIQCPSRVGGRAKAPFQALPVQGASESFFSSPSRAGGERKLFSSPPCAGGERKLFFKPFPCRGRAKAFFQALPV